MNDLDNETPDESELRDYYDRITERCEDVLGPGELIEPVLDDPLDIARRYYRER